MDQAAAATEAARFARMMEEGAALRRRLATESAAAVIGVVGACEARCGPGKAVLLRQWRQRGRCGASGDRADCAAAAEGGAALLAGAGADAGCRTLTAGGNDYGFEKVFARPSVGPRAAGDVLFGITTSGRSPNVLRALETAREMGIATVGFLGGRAGRRARSATTRWWCRTRRRRASRRRISRSATRSWNCSRTDWSYDGPLPVRRVSSACMWPRPCSTVARR